MATAADHQNNRLLHQIKRDLTWFPGRAATTWRVAALCALMAFVAMLYGIPESAISCYLILFVMKPDPLESIAMGLAVSILVSVVVGVIILILPLALESSLFRMSVLVVSSYAFLWFGSASKLGPVGSIIALVIAFVMSLLGNAPNGELATRAVLYAWLMAVSPMLLLVLFTLFFGRSSPKQLQDTVAERLSVSAGMLRCGDEESFLALRERLKEGQSEFLKQLMFIRLFHLRSNDDANRLEAAVQNSYRLMLAVDGQWRDYSESERQALAAWCERVVVLDTQTSSSLSSSFDSALRTGPVEDALNALESAEFLQEAHPQTASFFVEEAFSSPIHHYFALKTTAASIMCYLIYTAIDWQDIHTAMITCYVAALGTTGETVHKLTLRIVGCLFGAAAGILSLVFIIPMFTDIGQLMLLIFLVILPAAWVSTGNERIAYAGIQTGLAFLLTVLHGFAPATDLAVVTDRIIGILLGNLVVGVIFTQVWPFTIAESVRLRIRRAVKGLAGLAFTADNTAAAIREAATIEEEMSHAQDSLKLLLFEPASLRPSMDEMVKVSAILKEIETLCSLLFVQGNTTQANIQRLERLKTPARDDPLAPRKQNSETLRDDSRICYHISRLEELLE